MAQAGYTSVNLYYSSTTTNVPLAANMGAGELALNTADGKLFYKNSSGVVSVLAGAGASTTYVDYTPQTAPTYTQGRVWYDSTYEALSYYNAITGNPVHTGLEIQLKVYNNTGSTIAKGAAVYLSGGASGTTPYVSLAIGTSAAASNVLGLASAAITTGTAGYVTTIGLFDGFNTSTFTAGDTLYLSASSAGALTTTAPTAPNYAVRVGFVAYANASGRVYIAKTNNYTAVASLIGTVPTANGGTNLSSFTSGGAMYATSTSVLTTGTLPNTAGGTGQSSAFNQYGVTYANSTTTLATTASGTSTQVLHGNASGAPTWGAVSLTADITGTLAATNGGTGQSTYTVGDILYASSTSALSKLGLGTANQILAVNSGGTGLQWTSAAASGVSSISFGTTGLTPSGTGTGAITVAGTLATTNGGTGLISFNANGAVYASSSSALTTGTLPTNGGGTGLSSFTTNGAVYATSSSALATGTLPTASGGTGLITYTAGDLVYSSATNTLGKLNIGTAGYALVSSGTAPAWVAQYSSITFIIDGGGAAITTGIKGDLTIPFNCTITEWTILADQSGSIVVDVWKDVYANYPPTVADTITASAKPTVTSSIKNQSSTLTGWTTTITSGDTLRFNVDSVATIQRITISLKVYRT